MTALRRFGGSRASTGDAEASAGRERTPAGSAGDGSQAQRDAVRLPTGSGMAELWWWRIFHWPSTISYT